MQFLTTLTLIDWLVTSFALINQLLVRGTASDWWARSFGRLLIRQSCLLAFFLMTVQHHLNSEARAVAHGRHPFLSHVLALYRCA